MRIAIIPMRLVGPVGLFGGKVVRGIHQIETVCEDELHGFTLFFVSLAVQIIRSTIAIVENNTADWQVRPPPAPRQRTPTVARTVLGGAVDCIKRRADSTTCAGNLSEQLGATFRAWPPGTLFRVPIPTNNWTSCARRSKSSEIMGRRYRTAVRQNPRASRGHPMLPLEYPMRAPDRAQAAVYGIDISPVAVAIARAKLADTTTEAVRTTPSASGGENGVSHPMRTFARSLRSEPIAS